jgi:excinuclease UvrABC nuclease subunit
MGMTSKMFTSPDSGQKVLKDFGLQETKLLACTGCPYVSGRPCLLYGGNKCKEICVSDNNTQEILKFLVMLSSKLR